MIAHVRYAVAATVGLAAGLWFAFSSTSALTPTPRPATARTPRAPATRTAAATPTPAPTPQSPAGCAFPGAVPQAYETGEDRALYLQAMDLAGYNMLWPGDPFFASAGVEVGLRNNRTSGPVYMPPTLLKAIAWIESAMTQGAAATAWGTVGPALVSFDCGYGIMQVTSGMTTPLGPGGQPSTEQALVAEHFAYNIARGSVILAEKWNAAPEYRPIAGTDTNSDPHIVENWYFAVWSYNGFTGPGANRSNHPLDPIYPAWPRTPYSCGPTNDGLGHNRGQYPYQELVFGCASHPPIVQGRPLWTPLPLSLPDLTKPAYRNPLALANFVSPYSAMDIPSPAPTHVDPVPPPNPEIRQATLGTPALGVSQTMIRLDITPDGSPSGPVRLRIFNTGTGVLPWRITTNRSWLKTDTAYGVSMGSDLYCNNCTRSSEVSISIDAANPPAGSSTGVVTVEWLGTSNRIDIPVFVFQTLRIGVPGLTKN